MANYQNLQKHSRLETHYIYIKYSKKLNDHVKSEINTWKVRKFYKNSIFTSLISHCFPGNMMKRERLQNKII